MAVISLMLASLIGTAISLISLGMGFSLLEAGVLYVKTAGPLAIAFVVLGTAQRLVTQSGAGSRTRPAEPLIAHPAGA